ncbi:MAG: type I-C CRISPR-associated endonuclease Cas1 [Peptococcaceae bacterium]|nr:MAG: type I-C CRISPR-associated endonuclease Cas1 [Peptococcaceae bacterium]
MHTILNTLFITTRNSYLRLDHETVRIEIEGEKGFQVPLHHIGSVVCFGNVKVSPALLARCAEDGRTLVLLDQNGRFNCRLEGPVSGNVLLRRAQHLALSDPGRITAVARYIVAGKIKNCRTVVLRAARETENVQDEELLRKTAKVLASAVSRLPCAKDVEEIRGIEGEAARCYFSTFDCMVRQDRQTFKVDGRNRRPPRDPVNALLSFLYTLLLNDYVGALEGVGLDPQVGYLHSLRPGRPSLALDLMEELRAVLADRLALTLINRCQLTAGDFTGRPGGAIYLGNDGRKEVLVTYQKRKQEEVFHPVLERKVPLGLIPHVQARLLARYLRDDVDTYIPFIYR